MNLKEMTIEQLITLKSEIDSEIATREAQGNGFDKEFNLSCKAYHPATWKQYQFAESLASKTDSKIETTGSQICKRMEMEEISEAIDLMKAGKRIRIY